MLQKHSGPIWNRESACSSLVSATVITVSESSLERKGLSHRTVWPSLWRQSKNLEQCLSLACLGLAVLVTQLCLGMAQPTVDWAHPHQMSIRPTPHGLAHGRSDLSSFSAPYSQVTAVCVELAIITSTTVHLIESREKNSRSNAQRNRSASLDTGLHVRDITTHLWERLG